MNYLYFDIETFGKKPDPRDFVVIKDDIKVPASYKKMETIAEYVEREYESRVAAVPSLIDATWRKNALDPMKCQVICVGLKMNDEKGFYITDENEYKVLEEFQKYLSGFHKGTIMMFGWNSLKFDVPVLNMLSAKYELGLLRSFLPKSKYDPFHVDLMQALNPTEYNYYCKLSAACEFFGIEGKMEDVDGSMIHDMWLNGEKDKIGEYCVKDVEPLAVIRRLLMIGEPVIYR